LTHLLSKNRKSSPQTHSKSHKPNQNNHIPQKESWRTSYDQSRKIKEEDKKPQAQNGVGLSHLTTKGENNP
jgi:hypothetical protein